MNRIYNHTMICPQFRSSPYARHLATVALSDPGAGLNRRFLLSDMFAILCRNELLDDRDEDEQEEQAHSQFDHYDEIDERVDVVRHVRRQTSRAFRLAMPSPSSNMLIPIRQMQIVPYSPPPARTSYDENLALADRLGRVVIGVKNIKAILQPSPSDEPTLCPICQDMCSASEAVTTRHCNHAFCEPCITRWFRQSKYCPVCKHCFDDA